MAEERKNPVETALPPEALAAAVPPPCLLVLFGASGDLTKRKLVPALFGLFREKLLPEGFAVLGVSRTPYTDDAFRDYLRDGTRESEAGKIAPASWTAFTT